jgi:hypothetical protein
LAAFFFAIVRITSLREPAGGGEGLHPLPATARRYFFFFAAFFFATERFTSLSVESGAGELAPPAVTSPYFFFFLAAFFFAAMRSHPLSGLDPRPKRASQKPIASRRSLSACSRPRRS